MNFKESQLEMDAEIYFDINFWNLYPSITMDDILKKSIDEIDKVAHHLRLFEVLIFGNLKYFDRDNKYTFPRMSVEYMKDVILYIYPLGLFGTFHNFKKFCRLITRYCTASTNENIPKSLFLHEWNLSHIYWLDGVTDINKKRILSLVIEWLLDIFKCRILKRLFFIKPSLKNNKVNFYPIQKYQRLCSKSIKEMIGKNQLKQMTKAEIVEQSKFKCKSQLRITPRKQMTKYRPLVKTTMLRDLPKDKIREQFENCGLQFERNLYEAWKNFVNIQKDKQIYAVRLDLRDAFSNIDIDDLIPFIRKFLRKYPTYRDAIINSLQNQRITFCKQNFIWNRGLMQGMRFSAPLCNLVRSFFDKGHLNKFVTKESFFYRTCDDYMFAHHNKETVESVKQTLEKQLIISTEKTQHNLSENENENNERIIFMSRIFNLKTKEVELYVKPTTKTFKHKSTQFYDKNVKNDNYLQYLKSVVELRSNSYNFDKILLNVDFNSPKTVYNNYFKAMICIAFKMDWAVQERLRNVPQKVLSKFIVKTVKHYQRYAIGIICKDIEKGKPLPINPLMLKYAGIQAFILVLQKRYISYKDVINYLKLKYKFKHGEFQQFKKMPEEFANVRMKRVMDKNK